MPHVRVECDNSTQKSVKICVKNTVRQWPSLKNMHFSKNTMLYCAHFNQTTVLYLVFTIKIILWFESKVSRFKF